MLLFGWFRQQYDDNLNFEIQCNDNDDHDNETEGEYDDSDIFYTAFNEFDRNETLWYLVSFDGNRLDY